MNIVDIKCVAKDNAVFPQYKTKGSAGADICAFLEENITLKPMERALIPTGLFFEIPEGFEIQVRARSGLAIKNGIEKEKIIVDPGIGFGKNLEGNLNLISNCGSLCGGKFPVLMALSRKSCIGQVTGREVQDRLFGTLAADLISVLKGAFMVRVHDVAPCKDTLAVLKSLLKYESV